MYPVKGDAVTRIQSYSFVRLLEQVTDVGPLKYWIVISDTAAHIHASVALMMPTVVKQAFLHPDYGQLHHREARQ